MPFSLWTAFLFPSSVEWQYKSIVVLVLVCPSKSLKFKHYFSSLGNRFLTPYKKKRKAVKVSLFLGYAKWCLNGANSRWAGVSGGANAPAGTNCISRGICEAFKTVYGACFRKLSKNGLLRRIPLVWLIGSFLRGIVKTPLLLVWGDWFLSSL